ncbi:MAG: adenine phosphoribosyltransferase [Intrasporangium sp.]|uniref:adenine phosphoribosyltransferase n=1 Tax=Intrasporangium sp. TaxID=1925024 RepID=UPI002647B894|nr:adenine phosphoribosyltransferase [Intrasporangium sp.]MDN5796933.1 adenine phosphoribosyltransferase [Intrasporangium sp.]
MTPMAGLPVEQVVAARLRDVPDFPKPGVLFKDITPLLGDGEAFGAVVRDVARRHTGSVDIVVGIEARGFILAAAVAFDLGIGMVPVRKSGKLPGQTLSRSYTLEYGMAEIEVHADSFQSGQRVLVVDDVLATGGTAAATCELVESAGALVVGVEVVLELGFLGGRSRLGARRLHAILTL